MTYFKELSIFSYGVQKQWPMQNNVFWLGPGHSFASSTPDQDVLDLLWKFCSVFVNPTRGLHGCHLCPSQRLARFSRNGEERTLGSAEIRAFSNRGAIFAAPNLIYHYVAEHGYKPPEEFIEALSEGTCPPDPEYFSRLQKLGHDWCHIQLP
jgi:hypothetical protein